MAWTTPMTFVDNTVLTAADLNIHLRDNLMETEVAKATTPLGLIISDGPNKLLERTIGHAEVGAGETTTSTSYTDLTTAGPSVTVETGSRAFWFLTSEISIDTANVTARVSVAISGATNQPAANTGFLQIDGISIDKAVRIGVANYSDELTPGTNTFTCKYASPSGAVATFTDRNITVIPF